MTPLHIDFMAVEIVLLLGVAAVAAMRLVVFHAKRCVRCRTGLLLKASPEATRAWPTDATP